MNAHLQYKFFIPDLRGLLLKSFNKSNNGLEAGHVALEGEVGTKSGHWSVDTIIIYV